MINKEKIDWKEKKVHIVRDLETITEKLIFVSVESQKRETMSKKTNQRHKGWKVPTFQEKQIFGFRKQSESQIGEVPIKP